jgi:hypothetical protein
LTRYWNIEKYRHDYSSRIFELFVKAVPRKYCIDATGAEVILQLAIERLVE